MTKLTTVEGIGDVYAAKLLEAGIGTTEKLLESGKTSKGREGIAGKTGISPKLILEWLNRVDLMRVKGVGEEFSDLLEASGVDSVPELAQRNAGNLHAKMVDVNAAKKLVRSLPTVAQIEDWIKQAKEMPRAVEY